MTRSAYSFLPIAFEPPGSAAQLAALDRGLGHRLTLLLRPPDFDEVSLLRRWISAASWPAAVLSLTPVENEPRAFLASLTRSLSDVLGSVACASTDPEPALEDGLVELLNALTGLTGDFVWIFRDYDAITVPAIHRAVCWMLDYAPLQMHLYLTAQREPPLPSLPRLRVRRHLLTIHLQPE
jgi:LuxR family transcriptional regulator, maltose regulon positive regulatory protein